MKERLLDNVYYEFLLIESGCKGTKEFFIVKIKMFISLTPNPSPIERGV